MKIRLEPPCSHRVTKTQNPNPDPCPCSSPQIVILGYLFDNDTSFVVLLSATLGTGIEIWKVSKAFKMSFNKTKFPYIKLEDRWVSTRGDSRILTWLPISRQRPRIWLQSGLSTLLDNFGSHGLGDPDPEVGSRDLSGIQFSGCPGPIWGTILKNNVCSCFNSLTNHLSTLLL